MGMVLARVGEGRDDNRRDQRHQGRKATRPTHSVRNDNYNRCGMAGHWAKACRIAKHLVELYQDSQMGKM